MNLMPVTHSLPLPSTDNTFPNTTDCKVEYISYKRAHQTYSMWLLHIDLSMNAKGQNGQRKKVSCGNLYADKWSINGYVLSTELKSPNYCFVLTVVMPSACRRLPRGLIKGRKKEILRTWEKLLHLILNVKELYSSSFKMRKVSPLPSYDMII